MYVFMFVLSTTHNNPFRIYPWGNCAHGNVLVIIPVMHLHDVFNHNYYSRSMLDSHYIMLTTNKFL